MTDLESTHYLPGLLVAQATDAVVISRDRHQASGTNPASATTESIEAALEALLIDPGMRDLLSAVEATFGIIEIAEDEICAAQRRHRETPPVRDDSGKIVSTKGPLWRSFRLLRPTGVMADRAEFVYRAHCKELLDRIAHGHDTRPATGAEMVLALSQTSLAVPLRASATGLYMRLFTRCFPEQATEAFGVIDRSVEDYERLYAAQIDEQEAFLRRKAQQEWRNAATIYDQE